MKTTQTPINLTVAFVAYILLISCAKPPTTTVGAGITAPLNDDCPYQRLRFVGSSKVTTERGIMLLDSLSAALSLEKTALESGNVDNKLGLKISNMTKEVGNFAVPIRPEEATEYVKLSNSICTLRKDLYAGLFTTPELRNEAVKHYIQLLGAVSDLKKKLESK